MKLLCVAFVALSVASASLFSSNDESADWQSKAFAQANRAYHYQYDAQLSAGYAPWISSQRAQQRLNAQIRVDFASDRSAILRVQKARLGQLNDEVEASQLQHIQLSERAQIPEEKMAQLRLPVQFTIADGIVERVQFAKNDPTWSRNIKKAMINLMQLNLKQASFESVRKVSEQSDARPSTFTEIETTLEGECPVQYTVAETGKQQWNVTKAIQFNACRKVSDIAYGLQSEQAQSHLFIRSQQQLYRQQNTVDESSKQQQRIQPIPQEKLERSTVYLFQLRANNEKIALLNSETVSSYQMKSTNAENQNAQQVLALARLHLTKVEEQKPEAVEQKLNEEETLQYNSQYESNEKRFFMYGDEEFSTNPFHAEHSDESRTKIIRSHMSQIVSAFEKNAHESKQEIITKVTECLYHIRRCSQKTLKHIREQYTETAERELFDDLLAMSATRNTIAVLSHQLNKMNTIHFVKVMKSISGNMIAPSDKIAQHILDVCEDLNKEDQTRQQTCWIAFSAIVGQLNQQQQQARLSSAYPTQKEEQQVQTSLAEFQKVLERRWEEAENEYERVLALKCLANAALEKTLPLLEQIASGRKHSTFIRTEAVDTLRRFRFSHPQRIQEICMPIFENNREKPELRMAALSLTASTLNVQPEVARTIVDQIVYTLKTESSEQVRAFTYSLCRAYANSPVVYEQEVAQKLRQSLKIANLDEEESLNRASRHIRVPIYSHTEQEGVFVGASLAFSPESLLPTHVAAYVDNMLNGLVNKHTIYVSACQQNIDQWIQRLARKARSANRSASKRRNDLKQFLESIKIEKRQQSTETPFAMISIRVKDVDQMVLPLTDATFNWLMENAEQARMMADFFQITESTEGRFSSMISAHESGFVVPTPTGFKIESQQLAIVLAHGKIQGEVNVDLTSHLKTNMNIKRAQLAVEHQKVLRIVDPIAKKDAGVASHRTVELQTPKNMKLRLEASVAHGLKLQTSTEGQKVQLVALRTLPYTFVGKEHQKIQSIQNRQLQQLQREVRYNTESFRVSGLVHQPLDWTRPTEVLKTLLTAENHLTVDYIPSQNYEGSVNFKAHGFLFKPVKVEEAISAQLKQFSKQQRQVISIDKWTGGFEQEEEEEYDEQEQQRTDRFMSNYHKKIATAGTSNKAYKHRLVLVAEAGEKKSQLELEATCDASLTACRFQAKAQRPAIRYLDESNDWKVEANVDTLMPENMKDDAHNRFLARVHVQWGTNFDQKIKAFLSARPQARFPENVALFLNQIDVSADYMLHQRSQRIIERVYSLIKAYYYLQSEVYPAQKPSIDAEKNGHIRARLAIEPISRQTFNLTLQSANEVFHLENIYTPVKLGFYAQRQERRPAYHSVKSILSRASDDARAECRIQKNNIIQTFNDVEFRAPLSHKCYSVVAKDCQNTGEPLFVVLAKQQTSEQKNFNKIVKILTQDMVLEVQPASDKKTERSLQLTLNGELVKAFEHPLENMEYDGEELYARFDGVTVRFDGRKLFVKVSPEFANAQCGLCGHLNGEYDETFRRADNEQTDDVADFHRSYTVRDSQCDEEHLNEFYGNQQQRQSRFRKMDSESRSYDEYEEKDSEEWESGEYRTERQYDEESDEEYDYKTGKRNSVAAKNMIEVVERKHEICFSRNSVARCPQNSYSNEQKEKTEQRDFVCWERHSADARRMLREIRRHQYENLQKLADSLEVEIRDSVTPLEVQIHRECIRA
ncbi:unnamed protein product [Bursaphelenchus okinawaensis]|uniref:Vitellogenin n=1 Tax=Bursaphelenchus okinawaensis TaxID=465554 RepID=A0A811JUW8_9BILA|nr:unnamed protein product [Bursaphelenchus okinawaensis]CAG9084103.1 unnamed protein product [Bursaphelenchus okinawaensis]